MNQIKKFNSEKDLKIVLASNYQNQLNNYLGKEKALKFLSAVISSVQRNPVLLDCEPTSVINSFITMAELNLMPSEVSGEAYVLPYNKVAQFQLGYQGLVTLFYRAGAKSITAEIVYEKDDFTQENGEIKHKADPFNDDRGKAIGAYVIVELQAGGKIKEAMSKKQILDMGKRFSKSFTSKYSPWKEENDPRLWMWKKTVLKQVAKLVPKNETIYKAIAEDNKNSNVEERKRDIDTTKFDINIDDYSDKLEKVKDKEELKKVWEGFPQSAQNNKELIELKDDLKNDFKEPKVIENKEDPKVEPIPEDEIESPFPKK